MNHHNLDCIAIMGSVLSLIYELSAIKDIERGRVDEKRFVRSNQSN